MKPTLFVALVLIATFEVCHGAGKCYDEDTDHYWDDGTYYSPPGACFTLLCISKEDNVILLECAEYKVSYDINSEENCKITSEDPTKPYPECCPQIECPKSSEEKMKL